MTKQDPSQAPNSSQTPAEKRAADRRRLAQLIAELLAKDWLRRQADQGEPSKN